MGGAPCWDSAGGCVLCEAVLTDHLQALLRVFGVDVVQLLFQLHDFLCLDGDVCGLALRSRKHRKMRPRAGGASHGHPYVRPSASSVISFPLNYFYFNLV